MKKVKTNIPRFVSELRRLFFNRKALDRLAYSIADMGIYADELYDSGSVKQKTSVNRKTRRK